MLYEQVKVNIKLDLTLIGCIVFHTNILSWVASLHSFPIFVSILHYVTLVTECSVRPEALRMSEYSKTHDGERLVTPMTGRLNKIQHHILHSEAFDLHIIHLDCHLLSSPKNSKYFLR